MMKNIIKNNQMCCICYDKYTEEPTYAFCKNRHNDGIHPSCAYKYLTSKNVKDLNCPICRYSSITFRNTLWLIVHSGYIHHLNYTAQNQRIIPISSISKDNLLEIIFDQRDRFLFQKLKKSVKEATDKYLKWSKSSKNNYFINILHYRHHGSAGCSVAENFNDTIQKIRTYDEFSHELSQLLSMKDARYNTNSYRTYLKEFLRQDISLAINHNIKEDEILKKIKEKLTYIRIAFMKVNDNDQIAQPIQYFLLKENTNIIFDNSINDEFCSNYLTSNQDIKTRFDINFLTYDQSDLDNRNHVIVPTYRYSHYDDPAIGSYAKNVLKQLTIPTVRIMLPEQ
ncbi:RING finger protein [Cysteiniphilum sp. QT6929]|uniref:RING finger protein n=1 Tax=Cysteiniphilum sp. QT6929 TaxID=2975055 RepID=UPI0024B3593F|nr:RING finger protein [Cysteiniphilum sp. QT6929]WHN66619.1 RING finger protein [Cysteiniphilum sp. QT6929]